MPKVRIFPHRRADESSIGFGVWWQENGGVRKPIESLIEDWDYASELVVGLGVTIEPSVLLQSTGQSRLEDLAVVLVADCPASQQRIVTKHRLEGVTAGKEAQLPLRLPAGKLAEKIRLSAHLIVEKPSDNAGVGVANARGARLASSEPQTAILEGTASRFPIDSVSFDALGYPDVPWILRTSFVDPTENFMSTVRLWVNADNAVGRMLLASETAPAVANAAKEYVLRSMISVLADPQNDEFVRSEDFEEDSVGFVAGRMCELYLGSSLSVAVDEYRSDPVGFGMRLMERMNPYEGMVR